MPRLLRMADFFVAAFCHVDVTGKISGRELVSRNCAAIIVSS